MSIRNRLDSIEQRLTRQAPGVRAEVDAVADALRDPRIRRDSAELAERLAMQHDQEKLRRDRRDYR